MGARRRSEAPRLRRESRPTSSSFSICGAGRTASRATRGVDEVYALAADMGGMGFISHAPRRDPAQQPPDQHAHARGRAPERRAALSVYVVGVRLPRVSADRGQRRAAEGGRRVSRRSRRTPTAGRSWSPSGCACTTARTTAWRRASSASTTSSARSAPGTADARRRRRRCAARWPSPSSRAPIEIEIWGDGEQTRSFCYIDDCVAGIHRLMESDYRRAAEPRPGPPDQHQRAGRPGRGGCRHQRSTKRHVPGPQGVRGRNSDNTRLRQVLGWEPQISLEDGLARTYAWIEEQV